MELAFQHLRPDLVPSNLREWNWGPIHNAENAERALPCMLMIPLFLKHCPPNSRLRRTFLTLLTQEIPAICLWAMFLVDNCTSFPTTVNTRLAEVRAAYLVHAEMLSGLIKLDTATQELLIRDRAFLKTLIRLWTGKDAHGDVVMSLETTTAGGSFCCPIIYCVVKTVEREGGRENFTEVLLESAPSDQRRFIQAIIERIEVVSEGGSQQHELRLRSVHGLTSIIQHLTWQTPHLCRPLQKARYLKKSIIALDRIFQSVVTDPQLVQYLPKVAGDFFSSIGNLSITLMCSPSHIASGCREILASGVLPLLVRLASHNPMEDETFVTHFNGFIESIGWYKYHPSVLAQLMDIGYPNDLNAGLLVPAIATEWQTFTETTGGVSRSHREVLPQLVTLCDNPFVSTLSPSLFNFHAHGKPGQCGGRSNCRSRQCGGCSSVVYCSLPCQQQDWQERHREGCCQARVDAYGVLCLLSYCRNAPSNLIGLARRSSGTWYSHGTRDYHARLVISAYTKLHADLQQASPDLDPDVRFSHVLPSINFTPTGILKVAKVLPAADLSIDHWWDDVGPEGHKVTLPQTWLKPRLSQLFGTCNDPDANSGNARLVEASFFWGETSLMFLTVRLLKDHQGRFKANYCVQRYAERKGCI